MNMTIEQITAAYPNVAKLESQAGRELLVAVVGQLSALAAENAGLKSKLMFWDVDNPEVNYSSPEEIANDCGLNYGDEFEVQVAATLPNRTYRVCESWDQQCKLELVEGVDVQTPATDAFLAEVRANAITAYADKRGFSFQHGCIHAHFGNGDVMVGSVTFESGNAGICFAPVREKEGGLGTNYEWTRGKTAEQVESVFVIESSNAEGLEVIQGKLADAIAQLRQGAAL